MYQNSLIRRLSRRPWLPKGVAADEGVPVLSEERAERPVRLPHVRVVADVEAVHLGELRVPSAPNLHSAILSCNCIYASFLASVIVSMRRF